MNFQSGNYLDFLTNKISKTIMKEKIKFGKNTLYENYFHFYKLKNNIVCLLSKKEDFISKIKLYRVKIDSKVVKILVKNKMS